MSGKRYPEDFKIEAVKQVTERGHPATEVAARLGVSSHSLYQCVKRYSPPPAERQKADDQQAELKRLKALAGADSSTPEGARIAAEVVPPPPSR